MMRSFEQRMAEIQRRSELIRQKRKKRRKILLAACIPMLLCLTALTIWNLKPEAPQPDTVGGVAAGSGDGADGMTQDVSVSVTCGDRVYTQVEEILALVQTVTTPRAPQAATPEDNALPTEGQKDTAETNTDRFENFSDSSSVPLTFTIRQETESCTYRLTPTHLVNTETQEAFPLTQKQYDELMALLTR